MITLDRYINAKNQLGIYKKLEGELRIQLLEEIFKNNIVEGSNTVEINGYKVKGSFALNFKLDAKGAEEAYDDLSADEQRCLVSKLSLSKAAYKALEDWEREELDEFITVSPSMPTVEIERVEEE